MTLRIVSLGDSFTEGLGDAWLYPDGTPGGERGWADRVAEGIAGAYPDQEVWYANLAIRGRKLRRIVEEQLPAALALDPAPTLVTFNGGGNDMLRWDFSIDRVMGLSERVVDACEAAGVPLLITTGGAPSRKLPSTRRFMRLSDEFTDAVHRMLSGREGVTFVDNVHDLEFREDAYWSEDRLHLGPLGHARIAARVLAALGVDAPIPARDDAADAVGSVASELDYWRTHVLPWIGRRLRGKSSGDGRSAKYPDWVRVTGERPWLPVD